MRRVDNFLRTTHWIAESTELLDCDSDAPVDVDCAISRFQAETQAIRNLDEEEISDLFVSCVQWWIDRIDTSNGILVPCNGGTF